MTQDEAINLAVECGFTITHLGESPLLMASGRNVERFAKKLIEMEREACAMLCEETGDDEFYTGTQYAQNIRQERGEA